MIANSVLKYRLARKWHYRVTRFFPRHCNLFAHNDVSLRGVSGRFTARIASVRGNGEKLEALFKFWTGYLASGVEGVAGLIIAFAALQASVRALLLFFGRDKGNSRNQVPQTENIRLRLGRWLALALEFELGADILRTAIAPTWAEIGQLAAIAAIRTLLNYFLQQEIDRAARRQPDLALQSQTPPGEPGAESAGGATRHMRNAFH